MASISLIHRLKQRKLVQWALAYLAGAWLVLQLVDVLGERWGISDGIARTIDVALVVGFILALVLAWYHGEQGRQRISGPELLMIGGVLGAGALLLGTVDTDPVPEPVKEVAAYFPGVDDGRPRLAVLVFANRSQRPEDADFTAGVHDQILTELSKHGDLTVVSRTSVEEYRNRPRNIRQITSELRVSHVVEGAVQRAGDSVLVTAQLVDATDSHIWAGDYQRELTVAGLLGIQRELASNIARELGLQLMSAVPTPVPEMSPSPDAPTPEPVLPSLDLPTQSIEAWEAYTQSKLLPGRGRDARDQRIELLEKAIALDSSFPAAWAELARVHALSAGERAFESRPKARAALTRAQELDPGSPDALAAEAQVAYSVDRDLERALRLLEEREAMRPLDQELSVIRARAYQRIGHADGAVEAFEKALSLNPRSEGLLDLLDHMTSSSGRFDLTRRVLARWRLVNPDNVHPRRDLANLELYERGDTAAFLAALAELDAEPDWTLCGLDDLSGTRVIWLPYLRRQFESQIGSCTEGLDARGTPSVWYWVGTLAKWVGRAELAPIYSDSLQAFAESYIADLEAVDYGEYRWPLAWGWVHKARAHALADEREATVLAGRTAIEIFTPKNDVWDLGRIAQLLAPAYIQVGEFDRAVDALEMALRAPYYLHVPLMRLDPVYDPLRDHPRFQALLERHDQGS